MKGGACLLPNYFVSLCSLWDRQNLQYFFISNRFCMVLLFLVVV